MTHQDNGHYSDKHGSAKADDAVAKTISDLSENGRITCSQAHRISKELGLPPSEIGTQIDLLEIKITECQLGLFRSKKGEKNLDTRIDIPSPLTQAILDNALEGKLSCRQCWDLAARFKISRLNLGSACEKLKIRIKPCQLGTF